MAIGYRLAGEGDKLELPCGRCVGCRLDRAREWSIRITHEAQLHDSNLFVTLDYAPAHLPESHSLEYRDFQLFLKRLRKEVGPVRYFVSGEYGSRFKRPHWHTILFGCRMPDAQRLYNGTFRSTLMERVWQKGRAVIGEVTPQSAAYVAGYTQKKQYGRAAREAYEDVVNVRTGELTSRRPEFCRMSLRPGIGAEWYRRFGSDVFPGDRAVQDGKELKPPRFYFKKFQKSNPMMAEEVAYRRYEKALAVPREESSAERRAAKEECMLARERLYGERADL